MVCSLRLYQRLVFIMHRKKFQRCFQFHSVSILCKETIYIIPVLRDEITYIISVMCEETTSRGLCLPYMIPYSQFKLCHQFLLPVLHATAWEVLFSPTLEKIKRTSSGDNPHFDLGMRLDSRLLARKGGAGSSSQSSSTPRSARSLWSSLWLPLKLSTQPPPSLLSLLNKRDFKSSFVTS